MRGDPRFIPENRKSNFLKNGRFTAQIDITQFPSQTAHAAGHLLSAEQKVGKDSPKRGDPLFGISPFGAVLCTQLVEARKGRESKLSQLFNAADASLVFISVHSVTPVTRGFIKGGGWPHPLSFAGWVVKRREGESKPLPSFFVFGYFLLTLTTEN